MRLKTVLASIDSVVSLRELAPAALSQAKLGETSAKKRIRTETVSLIDASP
jgi:hypothetical protein